MTRKFQLLVYTFKILIFVLVFAPAKGQHIMTSQPISPKESQNLIENHSFVKELLKYKYEDSTITNYIQFDESWIEEQDYYYFIYQEQPRLEKISTILILKINRFNKKIYVYDPVKDQITQLDKWIRKHKKWNKSVQGNS